MNDRGEYRPFFGSILDDPDFQSMEGLTFKVLFALKLLLGPAGIGVPRLLALAEVVGCTPDELEESLALLEAPKPGEKYGWILRERNIIWLVNGLKHELLKPNNDPHKKRVVRQLAGLGGKPIVQAFRSYYHEWFDQNGQAPPSIEGASREPRGTLEGVSRHKTKAKRNEDETISENETGVLRGSVVDRFIQTFYLSATQERQDQIKSQLVAALSPEGVRVRKGEFVRARSASHLEKCISQVLQSPPDKSDAAIVWVIRKLSDPELNGRGETVTEAESARTRSEIQREEAYLQAKRAAAKPWADEHAAELKELEQSARIVIHGEGPLADISRKSWILERIATKINFPDFDAWASGSREMAPV